MSDPIETDLGVDRPVEDVLEQHHPTEDAPEDGLPVGPEQPGEADEADYAEQQIEVPLEDDRYPDASG